MSNKVIEEEEEIEVEDPIDDALWCARVGDLDGLKDALSKVPSYQSCVDPQAGSTPLHMACANGHVHCISYLLDTVHADQTVKNNSGSTALHWAVQNGQVEACRLLCAKPEADVLLRNGQGKSSTTLAIEKGNTDMVKILLEHASAAQLEAGKKEEEVDESEFNADQQSNSKSNGNEEDDDDNIQTHDSVFYFIKNANDPNPSFTIREIGYRPKSLEELAEGDATKTHFTVWAASVILARWLAREPLQGKSIVELGAGCGLSGIAAYRCCKPSRVLITDLEIRGHLRFNVKSVKKKMLKAASRSGHVIPPISLAAVDWMNEVTYPKEYEGKTDVLIGSDLVYDSELVVPLANICAKLAKSKEGIFYYVTANTDRAGMNEFIKEMKKNFVLESKSNPSDEFLKNPLGEEKQDLFELHLSELRDVEHTMYKFRRN